MLLIRMDVLENTTAILTRSGPQAWSPAQLHSAADAAGIGLWSWNVDTDEITLDERARDLWGIPVGRDCHVFEDLSAHIHPSDLDGVRTELKATRAILGSYDVDFRVVDGDTIRWISARGQGHDKGIVDGVMYGVFLDVTERKRAEETQEILAREMSHRVKNLFALVMALTTVVSRSTTTTTEMAYDLRQRLTSLGEAHELVRPVPGEKKHAALFSDLLTILLSPYDERSAGAGRIHISAPELRVGPESTTALALVIHELATNAVKYGALSSADGTLDISSVTDGNQIVTTWTERGGPSVVSPIGPRGFGSKLVTLSVSGQLGGSIDIDWQTEGVVVTLRIDKNYLAS
jgi:two-component sensor histidine kinase